MLLVQFQFLFIVEGTRQQLQLLYCRHQAGHQVLLAVISAELQWEMKTRKDWIGLIFTCPPWPSITAQTWTSLWSISSTVLTVLMTALSSLLSLLPCMLNTALLSSFSLHSLAIWANYSTFTISLSALLSHLQHCGVNLPNWIFVWTNRRFFGVFQTWTEDYFILKSMWSWYYIYKAGTNIDPDINKRLEIND